MKRFLFVIFLLLSITTCFALERPRWISQPILVYIPEYGQMSSYMKLAFKTWERTSNSLVRFSFVSSPNNANIDVEFVDFVSNCSSANAVGCTETSQFRGKYKKAYITIGTKEYYRYRRGANYTRKIVTRSKNNIYGVMLHEIGHALGLGHSDNPKSIMYPYDLQTLQYLTKDDMQLLYNKYH